MAGNTRRQECETAVHIIPIGRRQRRMLMLFACLAWDPSLWNGADEDRRLTLLDGFRDRDPEMPLILSGMLEGI